MINNGGEKDTPPINSETPVANVNTLPFFILLAIIIVVITIAVVFFISSQSQKSDNKTAPASQTPPIKLKTGYQNPFDKSTQYVNPFEDLK